MRDQHNLRGGHIAVDPFDEDPGPDRVSNGFERRTNLGPPAIKVL